MAKIDQKDVETIDLFKEAMKMIELINDIYRDLKIVSRENKSQFSTRYLYYSQGIAAEIETFGVMKKLRDKVFQRSETYRTPNDPRLQKNKFEIRKYKPIEIGH